MAGETLFSTFILSLIVHIAVLAAPAALAHSITDFVTCEYANKQAPHDWHGRQAVFRTSDEKFFAWVELREVCGVHSVEMKLYRPDGIYYGKETQPINETNGMANWWRMSAWWSIRGYGPARVPGRWKLDLLIDGAWQRSIYLNINSAKPVLVDPAPPAAAVCIIEASSDQVHWRAIQTNALPTGLLLVGRALLRAQPEPLPTNLRLTLSRDAQTFLLEAAPDLKTWTPIQTNELPRDWALDASGAPVAAARFYRAVLHD